MKKYLIIIFILLASFVCLGQTKDTVQVDSTALKQIVTEYNQTTAQLQQYEQAITALKAKLFDLGNAYQRENAIIEQKKKKGK